MKKLYLKMTLAAGMAVFAAGPTIAFQSDGNPKTADNQKNSRADVNLSAQIRKEILADKSLSTAAHNVKIISENGMVTLRGDVNSSEEKESVVQAARKIAGDSHVTDQITVAASRK